MVSNRNISCDTEEYNKFFYFVIIPALFVWGFLLPASIFTLLYSKKESLGTNKLLRMTIGSLYLEYRP